MAKQERVDSLSFSLSLSSALLPFAHTLSGSISFHFIRLVVSSIQVAVINSRERFRQKKKTKNEKTIVSTGVANFLNGQGATVPTDFSQDRKGNELKHNQSALALRSPSSSSFYFVPPSSSFPYDVATILNHTIKDSVRDHYAALWIDLSNRGSLPTFKSSLFNT